MKFTSWIQKSWEICYIVSIWTKQHLRMDNCHAYEWSMRPKNGLKIVCLEMKDAYTQKLLNSVITLLFRKKYTFRIYTSSCCGHHIRNLFPRCLWLLIGKSIHVQFKLIFFQVARKSPCRIQKRSKGRSAYSRPQTWAFNNPMSGQCRVCTHGGMMSKCPFFFWNDRCRICEDFSLVSANVPWPRLCVLWIGFHPRKIIGSPFWSILRGRILIDREYCQDKCMAHFRFRKRQCQGCRSKWLDTSLIFI